MSAALAETMRELGYVGAAPLMAARGRSVYLLSGSEYERDCWDAECRAIAQAQAGQCKPKRKASGGMVARDAHGVVRPRGWTMQTMLEELSRSDGSASELGRAGGINPKSAWPTMIHLCNLGYAREVHVANDARAARRDLHKGTKKIYRITAEGLEWLKGKSV